MNAITLATTSSGIICGLGAVRTGALVALSFIFALCFAVAATYAVGIRTKEQLFQLLTALLPKPIVRVAPAFGWFILVFSIIAVSAAIVGYLVTDHCVSFTLLVQQISHI